MNAHREPEELQDHLRYSFADPGLLIEALTHKSFQHEHPHEASSYNERLEFLGDSVLGLCIADYLFGRGQEDEAEMSKIKSFAVKGKILAEAARAVSLGDFLRLGRGEEDSGGRDKDSLLANALEAVIGAVFLDRGYLAARALVLGLLKEILEEAVLSGEFADYKSELQELSQTITGRLPEYRLVGQEGEEHNKVFTAEVLIGGCVEGRGSAGTKKEAQARAAHQALEKLRSTR